MTPSVALRRGCPYPPFVSANRRRRPVIYDVARLAGVSHQTVSRVINGSDRVRPETRDRVVAAMQQLDYRPNSMANWHSHERQLIPACCHLRLPTDSSGQLRHW